MLSEKATIFLLIAGLIKKSKYFPKLESLGGNMNIE